MLNVKCKNIVLVYITKWNWFSRFEETICSFFSVWLSVKNSAEDTESTKSKHIQCQGSTNWKLDQKRTVIKMALRSLWSSRDKWFIWRFIPFSIFILNEFTNDSYCGVLSQKWFIEFSKFSLKCHKSAPFRKSNISQL